MNSQLSENSERNQKDLDFDKEISNKNYSSNSTQTEGSNQVDNSEISPVQAQNCNLIDDFSNVQISHNHENQSNFCNQPIDSKRSKFIENNQCDIKQNQVRTLFVSGLPMDVRERELYLLFQGFQGFHCATLRHVGALLTRPVAFVTFETRKDAIFALKKMNGIAFDLQSNAVLKIEFAKSNTKFLKSNHSTQTSQQISISSKCIF